MNDASERLKALGLTQEVAGRIVGLSPITVNRQVRGHYPLSAALIYLIETWDELPSAVRKKVRKRVGIEVVTQTRVTK